MRISCLHGYFIFEESRAGQISEFASLFEGFILVPKDNYYTFEFLKDAPSHSIEGNTYLGAAATKTIEGRPWEILRANNLVYDFNAGELVGITSISDLAVITPANNYSLSPGLIMPGSIKDDGTRVRDYSAWFSFDSFRFKYSFESAL